MSGTIKVAVTSPPTPRVQSFYANPQVFRVQGAADVMATGAPSENGYVLTWNASTQSFILAQQASDASANLAQVGMIKPIPQQIRLKPHIIKQIQEQVLVMSIMQ